MIRSGICFLMLALLTGCGFWSSVQSTENPRQTGPDLTHPPEIKVGDLETESESNPDEEISYEAWLKQREDSGGHTESVDSNDEAGEEVLETIDPGA